MRWKKLGRIFAPSGVHPKLASHAANPLAVHLHGDVHRIFYSGRDAQNRSSVGWFDFDLAQMTEVGACDRPAFEYGPAGSFYSHGVSIGGCYETGDRRYMLFMGWHIPEGGHWRGEIGRLVLGNDLSLTLADERPFIALSEQDPISLSYPWVIKAGASYRMWYGSTVDWDAGNGEMLHIIKGASSTDGENWCLDGPAVPHAVGVAQAFSRPTVVQGPAGYDMWFSFRSGAGEAYRIGRASSADARAWSLRLDQTGIKVSADGWDSLMIEYPFVFRHGGRGFMLYNGNGYGETGIGLAVSEELEPTE